ncbi:3344_t:CDS:2, partial [Acaulospora colombiana]
MAHKILGSTNNDNFHNRIDIDCGLSEVGLLNTGLALNLNYERFQRMDYYWGKLEKDVELELPSWMKRYFMETTFLITASKSVCAMSNYYNTISQNKETSIHDSLIKESDEFLGCIIGYLNSIIWFSMIPKFVKYLPEISHYTNKTKKQVEWLKSSLLNIVKTQREEIDGKPDEELAPDMLKMFLTLNTSRDITKGVADGLNHHSMSDVEISLNLIEIITAGIDTSANSACYAIYMISKYPHVKEKFLKELDTVLGRGQNFQITYEGINKLAYCEAVIKEGIHKHRSNWTDPDVFNPNRFMDESHPDYKKEVYMFGGGSRKC